MSENNRSKIFIRIPLSLLVVVLISLSVLIPVIIGGVILNTVTKNLVFDTYAGSISSSIIDAGSDYQSLYTVTENVERHLSYVKSLYQFTMYVVDQDGNTVSSKSYNLEGTDDSTYPLTKELARSVRDSTSHIVYDYNTYRGQLAYIGAPIGEGYEVVCIFPVSQFTNTVNNLWFIILGTLLLAFILVSCTVLILRKRLVIPLRQLLYTMRNPALPSQLSPYLEWENEIGRLCLAYSKRAEDYTNKLSKINDFNNQKRKFEIEALQNQINSHFIYNTLNNIQWLALAGRTNDVIATAKSLFYLLQAFCQNDNEMVTLEEELSYVESYLIAQKIRFEEVFNYEFEIDALLMQMKIPKFILQPIVENSIYHGFINCNKKNGLIKVSVERRGHRIEISVYDNGIGIEEKRIHDVLSNKNKSSGRYMGVALGNVNKRIKLLCGREYGLGIHSIYGSYTITEVTLPIML